MCGIFGIIANNLVAKGELSKLMTAAEQRGKDSSGFFAISSGTAAIYRSDDRISTLKDKVARNVSFIMGHSRLITNGTKDNQPIYRDDLVVIHNGILVNHDELWAENQDLNRYKEIDTEIIPALIRKFINAGMDLKASCEQTLSLLQGQASCAVYDRLTGALVLFSNNGSLYVGEKGGDVYFSSEAYPLKQLGVKNILKIIDTASLHMVTEHCKTVDEKDYSRNRNELVRDLYLNKNEAKLLLYPKPQLKRCTKCVLPETMPYISFDEQGVCNYCKNYTLRNEPADLNLLKQIVAPFKNNPVNGLDCIVPFSGGRDSSYALHFIVEELGMRPLTYTYDWGMVTDLARRNISRMCAKLGVENIIVAADIELKRSNIRKNFKAWLKHPNLGMVSILTAGDKHFYRHVQTIKRQTGLSLDLWGVNPLEVTHFKAGFLGVPPYFAETKVYNNGLKKQLRYQALRFKAMTESLGYFNASLFDTLSGEYYRSIAPKKNYHHIFDYWKWDENQIDQTLVQYDWERATDTKTTWRIGDGTAAMYNYIYYTMAGFTEHDTFRSNQIREGQLSRDEALTLIEEENAPRYENIKWYLDLINLPFSEVISTINKAKTVY